MFAVVAEMMVAPSRLCQKLEVILLKMKNQVYKFESITYIVKSHISKFFVWIYGSSFHEYFSDIKFDTSSIAQQINELEETVKAMRATLFLVCRGRLLEKQIGNVKILKWLNLKLDFPFNRKIR